MLNVNIFSLHNDPADCVEKWSKKSCNVDDKPSKDFIYIDTQNIIQLCESSWGFGQIYRRFTKMINETNRHSISIFNGAKVDHNGILEAIKDLARLHNGSLAKFGESNSIRYFGDSEKTKKDLKSVGKVLKWKMATKYVSYKNQSCGEALVIGKGA